MNELVAVEYLDGALLSEESFAEALEFYATWCSDNEQFPELDLDILDNVEFTEIDEGIIAHVLHHAEIAGFNTDEHTVS